MASSSTSEWWDGNFIRIAQFFTSLLLLLSLLAPHLPASIQSFKLVRLFIIASAPGSGPTTEATPKIEHEGVEHIRNSGIGGFLAELSHYFSGELYSAQTSIIWRRVAQRLIFNGEEFSLLKRLRVYLALASAQDAQAHHALIGHSIYPTTAAKEWAQLSESDDEVRKLAFSKNIEETIRDIENAKGEFEENMDLPTSLARFYTAEKMDIEAREVFTSIILGSGCRDEAKAKAGVEMRQLRKAVRTLGADIQLLFDALEDLGSASPLFTDLSELEVSGSLAATRDMIQGTQIFMQLFPTREPGAKVGNTPLSPPPSPSKLNNRLHSKRKHELRCLLGRPVFDQAVVEDARDVVVDLLTRTQ